MNQKRFVPDHTDIIEDAEFEELNLPPLFTEKERIKYGSMFENLNPCKGCSFRRFHSEPVNSIVVKRPAICLGCRRLTENPSHKDLYTFY